MTAKEIKTLLELCKKYGVKRVKTADIELELGEGIPTYGPALDKALEGLPDALKEKSEDQYSEEDVLMWSSQGV